MHYLLLYEVVPDYVARRAPLRTHHLELVKRSYEAGDLVLAGALADPVDQAVFIFRSENAARRFAEQDPYVTNNLVTNWTIRRWNTVIGDGAEWPVL
jgi:uncharacterized protein YciI